MEKTRASKFARSGKSVVAGRADQHAGRARSPENPRLRVNAHARSGDFRIAVSPKANPRGDSEIATPWRLVLALAIFFAACFPARADITTGLTARWLFDETSGLTAAPATGPISGAIEGGVTLGVAGKIGTAFSFDGTDDRVQLTGSAASLIPATGAFTFAMFVKLDGTPGSGTGSQMHFFSCNAGQANRANFGVIDTNADGLQREIFWFHNGGLAQVNTTLSVPNDGAFHLVALTRDAGGNFTAWLDTASFSLGSSAAAISLAQDWRLGSAASEAQFRYKGAMDEVRVYNRALPAADIAQLAALTNPDTTPPEVLRATAPAANSVAVLFSEAVTTATATNLANYALTVNGAPAALTGAALSGDGKTVTLTTAAALPNGATARIAVSNVQDTATPENPVPAGSAGVFVVGGFSYANLGGNPAPALTTGTMTTLTSGGSGLGGASDQGTFGSAVRTGDFDVRTQLTGLTRADVWTRFALMARESSTAPGSRFAAAVATPTLAGCFFQWRDPASIASQQAGAYPPNLPYLWLRLKRAGNVFTGYASNDGQGWTLLGSATIALPATVEVGVSLASQSATAGGTATAQFANFGDVSGTPALAAAPATEPPGPSSRHTALAITEIFYNDRARNDGRIIEFVELFNSEPMPADLGGWRLSGDVAFTFPPGTALAGGAYLVVARAPADMQAEYGLSGVLGPYTGTLKKSGVVRLRDDLDGLLLESEYDNAAPWPAGADGTGHSLVLRRPSYGENDPRAWAASDRRGGSPGAFDALSAGPGAGVIINEFLANSESPLTDFVELYNRSTSPVDLAGCTLSDDPALAGYTIPAGTVLAPGAFVAFSEATLGFSLGSNGDNLFLRSPEGLRVLDAVRFSAQLPNVSEGRAPDGAPDFISLAARTPGGANAARLVPEVVINELHIKPGSGDAGGEFVELRNLTGAPIDLGGWKLKRAVSFMFPAGTTLAPNGFVAVAENRTALLAADPALDPAVVFGNFSGSLGNTRDLVRLTRPMTYLNALGQPATDDATVDEVAYGDVAPWGRWADGGGSSLEKRDARADGRRAAAWADSDETAKASWTTIEATGRIDLGQQAGGDTVIDRLEIMLGGAGESLLDDLEVTVNGGGNLVANPSFNGGIGGYVALGSHSGSGAGSGALHLRATSAGDTVANRVHTILTGAIPTASTCTIRARVRWLAGSRQLLLRLEGNWHELSAALPVPAFGGTPGAPNTRAAANLAPAIYDITATPVLPAANEPVRVTARFDDPDGVTARTLSWRLDPSATFANLTMRDDGTGGDELAGDGLFTAMIPGQNAGALVAWNIGAIDAATASAQAFTEPALALVRFGEAVPASAFVTQRFWMTAAEHARWTSSSFLSNASYSGTLVVGNARAIYGADIRFAGSASKQGKPQYATPTTGPAHYSMNVPRHDRFLGTDDFSKLHAPGNDPFADATLQYERAYYWAAHRLGIAGGHRRYFVWMMNGNRHGTLMEDAVQADARFLDAAFPDAANGALYRMNIWVEAGDTPATPITATTAETNGAYCTLSLYNTTHPVTNAVLPKIARHRWTWDPRAGASWNDYTPILELVATASQTTAPDFPQNVNDLLDLDQWARVIALDHACGNGDSYGNRNGQNMYAYRPFAARWLLLPYDRNLVFGYDFFPATDLFQFWQTPTNAGRTADPNFVALLNHPAFRRAYWSTYAEINARVFDPASMNPMLDAAYRAFVGDGLAVSDPSALKSWVATQRANIASGLGGIGGAAWSVTTANNQTVTNGVFALAGTAPSALVSITVNGLEAPLAWSSLTAWSTAVLLRGGANTLVITGRDREGGSVGSTTLTVNFTGTNAWPPIRINEWMASNGGFVRDPADNDADDWIELFNPTTSAANLEGWFLSDSGTTFTIPPGFAVPAGGYLIVWADNEPAQNNLVLRPDLHVPFALGASGDAITLTAPDGTVMDTVTFGAQAANKTSGHWPAAAPNAVLALDAPTFGAANLYTPPAPQVASFSSSAGSFMLAWSSVAGLRYAFERSLDLSVWTPLQTVTATTATSLATDSAPAAGKAFYRARVLTNP